MADEKTPSGPGIKKAPPRPSERYGAEASFAPVDPKEIPTRPQPILPSRRLTPLGMAAVTGDEHEPDMRPVSTDAFPTDTESAEKAVETKPLPFGLSEAQIQAIADQLKTITVSTLRKSSIPPAGRPSLPVRAAKYAWTKSPLVGLGVTILGIAVEIGARAYLDKAGPGTQLVYLLGQILERMAAGG